jgi:hypothetical protein
MTRRDQCVSRTNLSKQAGALRLSLLVALGLSPLSCGGSTLTGGEGGSGGFTAQGGGVGYAGAAAVSDVASLCSGAVSPITKLAACDNGLIHRPEAIACDPRHAAGQGGAAGAGGNNGMAGMAGAAVPSSCTSNADCSMLNWGWCKLMEGGPGGESACFAGCLEDSDCSSGGLCRCDPETPAGKCVYGNCHVDSDCGPNSVCAQVEASCGPLTFQCSHGADECRTKADCPVDAACSPSPVGRLFCKPDPTVCGRPFLVQDAPRVAEVASRTDWLDESLTPNLSALSPTQRAELAAHWARLGQMEHASIAAFARFNLQLLSLGAPAELVEACNRALADETTHTRLCFALASRYAGTKLGPARLEIQHCFEDNSLKSVMRLVLNEGCIGETVAALEALNGADSATDPVVRRVLQRIAHDEQTHAELAFKFMQWALLQCSPELREELAAEAENRLSSYEPNAESNARASASHHVVRPLLAAIFSFSALPSAPAPRPV